MSPIDRARLVQHACQNQVHFFPLIPMFSSYLLKSGSTDFISYGSCNPEREINLAQRFVNAILSRFLSLEVLQWLCALANLFRFPFFLCRAHCSSFSASSFLREVMFAYQLDWERIQREGLGDGERESERDRETERERATEREREWERLERGRQRESRQGKTNREREWERLRESREGERRREGVRETKRE